MWQIIFIQNELINRKTINYYYTTNFVRVKLVFDITENPWKFYTFHSNWEKRFGPFGISL